MLVPVILAGGVGSRLWPLSREHYPKQFIPLVDERQSLLQSTLLRLQGLEPMAGAMIVCNQEHRFLVAEQLRQIDQKSSTIILEPVARNTAPAVALAAFEAIKTDEDAVLLVLPADHLIRSQDQFQQAVREGVKAAEQGELVTFGVVPDRPETGFGYIRGAKDSGVKGIFRVEHFAEKPDAATARTYLESGDYYWNSGMFIFRAQAYLAELEKHAQDIYAAAQKASDNAVADLDFQRVDTALFAACRGESIDYAVMEKTEAAVVLPLQGDWSDVGAWDAIWDVSEQDGHGNAVQGDVVLNDVCNSYVRAESRLVAGVGLDGLVVVETADAVLVADKSRVQDVKKIVERLQSDSRSETRDHTRVYRPWGSYETISIEGRFQAKRIVVAPGATLSLQLHHHRAEHWVVVKGCGLVTRGDETFRLNEDQSTYIPIGTRHRLENPGLIPLEIIEVQTGSYLGEDDIVRFDDQYGRKS